MSFSASLKNVSVVLQVEGKLTRESMSGEEQREERGKIPSKVHNVSPGAQWS